MHSTQFHYYLLTGFSLILDQLINELERKLFNYQDPNNLKTEKILCCLLLSLQPTVLTHPRWRRNPLTARRQANITAAAARRRPQLSTAFSAVWFRRSSSRMHHQHQLRCCSGLKPPSPKMVLVSLKPPETPAALFCSGLVEAALFVLFSSFV